LGGSDRSISAVQPASADAGNRLLRVGVLNLQENIGTLNPLTYTMGAEFQVIYPCYSFVLTRDEDNNIIGDLAVEWVTSPDGLEWYIRIVTTAKFFNKNDPSNPVPLTVRDIIFTYWLVQNNSNNLQYYFPEIPGSGGRLIASMTAINNWEMTVTLRQSFAPFLSALLGVPILPQYIWEGRAINWDNYDTRNNIPPCVGSGAFYYGLDAEPTAGVVDLYRSPTWFATIEYGWQVHVNRLTLKSEADPSSNLADWDSGAIDMITGVTPAQYLAPTFPGSLGVKFQSSQGFVFEFNLNQLSDANRAYYGIGGPNDWNNQILLDPVLKTALHMVVDRELFVSSVLRGLGSPANSLIPPMQVWHWDPTPEEAIQYDPAAARQLLYDNGWRYRTDGTEILPGHGDYLTYAPLCKVGGTEELVFRMCSPDTMDEFIAGSRLIQAAALEAGMILDYDGNYFAQDTGPLNTNQMNTIWYNADYDTWVWDWWFVPTSEPSLDIMQVLATEAIGTWSDVYWSNPEYDALYYRSLTEPDPTNRKAILDEMQRMAYFESGCLPVAYMDMLYGAQTVSPDQWTNFGNWNQKFALVPDMGYPYLFMKVVPKLQMAPEITSMPSSPIEGEVNKAVAFNAFAVDDHNAQSQLEYRWVFGDGTNSGWQSAASGFSASHTYTEDGIYTAYFNVREAGTLDLFHNWSAVKVRIVDLSNTAPHSLDFTISPTDPDTGTTVYLNGTAVDDQGDELYFTWNFGDGHSGVGQFVTHQFASGSSTVTMYVDDKHLGTGTRPSSYSEFVAVTPNSAPTVSVRDDAAVQVRTSWEFQATVSDSNSRDTLRLTWQWGDGDPDTVQEYPSTGGSFTARAYHTYDQQGTYTVTVWTDDLTGLAGHNVSDTGLMNVVRTGNRIPEVTDFHVSDEYPETGQEVTFYVTATDGDGDILDITVDFDDGTTTTVTGVASGETITVVHAYDLAGLYVPAARATDGQATSSDANVLIEVTQASFVLSISAGWNMVGIPLVNGNYKASTLGLVTGDVVVRWDSATGVYDKTYIVGISPPTYDFAIVENYGYWIYAPASRSLTLYGNTPTESQYRAVDVVSGGGWAMVSLASLRTDWMASDLVAMYTPAGAVTLVAWYDPSTGTYKTYIPGLSFTDFALAPGRGYWIYCNEDGTMTYDP
jgi:peptide/nickel transport system substrate-binding protein